LFYEAGNYFKDAIKKTIFGPWNKANPCVRPATLNEVSYYSVANEKKNEFKEYVKTQISYFYCVATILKIF
jgi:hypothetical protein